VGYLSWMTWRSTWLAIVSALLYTSSLGHWATMASPSLIGDTLWPTFLMLAFLAYRTGRHVISWIFCYLAIATKEFGVILFPILLIYELCLTDLRGTPWSILVKRLIRKQGVIALCCGLFLLRGYLLFLGGTSPARLPQVGLIRYWGSHLLRNFLLGLQWMVPYHGDTSPLYWDPRLLVYPWAVVLGGVLLLLSLIAAWHLKKSIGYLLCWFVVGYFPWVFFLGAGLKTTYGTFPAIPVYILAPGALWLITKQPWPTGVGLAVALISSYQSTQRLNNSYAAVTKEQWVFIQELFEYTKRLVPQAAAGHVFIYTGLYPGYFTINQAGHRDGLRFQYGDPTIECFDIVEDRIRRGFPCCTGWPHGSGRISPPSFLRRENRPDRG